MKKPLVVLLGVGLLALAVVAAVSSLTTPESDDTPDRPDAARSGREEGREPVPPPIPDAASRAGTVVAVAGRVVGPDGAPLADAEVTLSLAADAAVEFSSSARLGMERSGITLGMSGLPDLGTLDRATTGAGGQFELRSDLDGPFVVTARLSGYAVGREASVAKGTTDVVIRLGLAAQVRGMVEEEGGGPIEGAVVEGGGDSALTDAKGAFLLASFPAGEEHEVVASAEGFEKAMRSVTAPAGKTEDLAETFVLKPLPGVSGRVFDPEGEPLPGVSVTAVRGGMFDRSSSTTDRGGRYHLGDLPTGDVDLQLRHREYLPGELDRFRYTKGERIVLRDVRLEAGGEIVGKVVGPDGKPVPGARATALNTDEGFDFSSVFSMAMGGGGGGPKSDATGEYRVAGLTGGTYTLAIRAQGYRPFKKSDILVVVPESTRVDVTLDPGKSIAGRVVDEEGNPIAGASVSLEESQRPPTSIEEGILMSMGGSGATTGEDGSFVIAGLGDDPVGIGAQAEGFGAGAVDDVEPGARDVVIELSRAGSISGRVVDAETGEGVPGTEVSVPGESDLTGVEGEFRLRTLSSKTYTLTADNNEYAPATVTDVVVEVGRETRGIEIQLARGETLGGVVVDALAGAPIGGAEVSLEGPAERSAETDPEGRFAVRGLLPGAYELSATAKGFAKAVIPAVRIPSGESIRIALEKGAVIRGVVRGSEGEPQSGRMIMLGEGGMFGSQMTTTSSDGEFTFDSVAPGRHTLIVMNLGGGGGGGFSMDAQTKQVTVGAGEEVFVEFGGRAAAKTATVTGRLLDRGKPLASRMLMIMPVGRGGGLGFLSGMKMVTTDKEGRFNLPDMEPGRYAVMSGRVGSQDMTVGAEIVIAEGGEIERDIELPPGRLAGKVVRGDTGEPVEGARVTLLDPARAAVPARSVGDMFALYKGQAGTGEDGTFEIGNAPVGRFILQVRVEGLAPKIIDGVTVAESGGAPLAVTLVPGSSVTVSVADPTGEPVARAAVYALEAGGRVVLLSDELNSTTGPDGKTGFRLAPGDYRVLVQASGYAQARAPLTVRPGADAEVPVTLASGGTVRVHATAGGAPVADADVRVFGADGLEIAERVTQQSMMTGAPETATAADGTLTLTNQPAGTLRIVVTAPDGRKGEGSVRVTEAGDHALAVELR